MNYFFFLAVPLPGTGLESLSILGFASPPVEEAGVSASLKIIWLSSTNAPIVSLILPTINVDLSAAAILNEREKVITLVPSST